MVANQPIDDKQSALKHRALRIFGAGVLFALTACSPQGFFFYPNRVLYNDPDRFNVVHETVTYPSLDGKTLVAVYFRTDQKPIGTVVHLHGNFGNISNHFPLALFLTHYGFDVLSFDYQGYGASEGHPSIKNIIDDGRASVAYAAAHSRTPTKGVVLFGQSLGASAAIVVAAKEPSVRAIVVEAAFTGYRAMARKAVGRHVLMWPLYPFIPLVPSKDDPIRFIGSIAPRPIFLIHGDSDTIVPSEMSRKLYAAARDPKRLWIVPDAGHLEAHRKNKETYEKSVAQFFANAFTLAGGD